MEDHLFRTKQVSHPSWMYTRTLVEVLGTDSHRPTWIEPKMTQNLQGHPDLASSLILLKSPDWYHTLSLYPVSTLAADCNLIVDTNSNKVYMNVRRNIPGVETEVYVVRGRTTGSSDARKVVKVAVDAARTLVGGVKDGRPSKFWDGLGVCTWESFGKESTPILSSTH